MDLDSNFILFFVWFLVSIWILNEKKPLYLLFSGVFMSYITFDIAIGSSSIFNNNVFVLFGIVLSGVSFIKMVDRWLP